jgi:hypothetical protein
VGLVLGLGAAYATGQLVSTWLYEVHPFDPLILAMALALVLTVTLFATFIPVRWAHVKFTRMNHCANILFKKVEDVREAGAPGRSPYSRRNSPTRCSRKDGKNGKLGRNPLRGRCTSSASRRSY